MIYKKFPINSVSLSCTSIKSSLRMQLVEIKTKSERVTVTIMWLGFAGSLSCSCAGFFTFGILIRYGCATWETH